METVNFIDTERQVLNNLFKDKQEAMIAFVEKYGQVLREIVEGQDHLSVPELSYLVQCRTCVAISEKKV